MIDTLLQFVNTDLRSASLTLLDKLGMKYTLGAKMPFATKDLFKDQKVSDTAAKALDLVTATYFVALIDNRTFDNSRAQITLDLAFDEAKEEKYSSMFVFAIDVKPQANLTFSLATTLTRAFNRLAVNKPVVLIIKQNATMALSICERTEYSANQSHRSGEKLGRVTVLRGIDCQNPHRGHLDILNQLDANDCSSFDDLYRKWMTDFGISLLNNRFYKELQEWFYWASSEIKLPEVEISNLSSDQQNKNFLVRTLSRLMFCWFIKERGLINKQLLELVDFHGNRYPILKDINVNGFLEKNSYYRGVLQNIFFNGLNNKKKVSKKDFKCIHYLPDNFDYNLFMVLPYLNCGTFDPLQEDFNNESIEDDAIRIPNKLFYGDGNNHKGINQIFNDYRFTIEENTPLDIDIALDPEMLGMVFENLLAEIDPNNDQATSNSIRRATGSYYTPRPVIQSMVNESLLVYLNNRLKLSNDIDLKECISELIYHDTIINPKLNKQIVKLLSSIRVLDPACGSGAFPMGMLQRIVDLLRIVDPGNKLWLDLMLEPIEDRTIKERFKKQLEGHQDDYSRKLGIIQNCIYGIDIQPIAVQITKLRFFISLLIDQKIDRNAANFGITPLPNLETKIVCADSLKSISVNLFEDSLKQEIIKYREEYYQPEVTYDERNEKANKIAELMNDLYPSFATSLGYKAISNQAVLKKWFMTGSINAPFFDMKTFFPEIEGGFDIVIGNPPYGGFKIDDEVKEALELGNKDPYGAFISRFLGNGQRLTPLKNGGVLSFIVSDTFMTIGTHLKLRQQMMHNKIYKMVRMSPKTFSATVNTVVIVCEKCKADTKDSAIEGNICQMADMSNIDIHEDFEHFLDILSRSTMQVTNVFNEEYAIYNYEQKLIKNCSNMPFFVASPKLFGLMNDADKDANRGVKNKEGVVMPFREASINTSKIKIVNLGLISEVKTGLQTGDNPAYLFQDPEARGTYNDINMFIDYVLNADDFDRIIKNNKLRLDVIENGINKNDTRSQRYFGGRYILPYDKGGESDSDGGWLPNYYVPTNYYIDWSEWAVNRMKTLTIADRIRINKERKPINARAENTLAAVIRSPQTYFLPAINVSRVGMYSPTFRVSSNAPYDSGCNNIFTKLDTIYLLGILCSKLYRFLFINYVNGTVNSQTDDHLLLPIVVDEISGLKEKVEAIIKKQQEPGNLRYDYASHEQIEIDKMVYDSYGLNEEDINEVETWFVRRYPKLASAQRSNLEKLKKV